MSPAPNTPVSVASTGTVERVNSSPISGLGFLIGVFCLAIFSLFLLTNHSMGLLGLIGLVVCAVAFVLGVKGLIVLNPNTAAVFTLFGTYSYTILKSGF